jgi:hypothetical protein
VRIITLSAVRISTLSAVRISTLSAVQISTLSAALLTTFTGGALLGAAPAAAAVPVVQPDQGRIGVNLSHPETAALADGPLPALITKIVPTNLLGAGLQPGTQLYRDENGIVHASLREVIEEAADHPDGSVTMYLNAPGTRGSRLFDIYQRWN